MNVAVSEAKAQLTELVRRAQAGEEIVLTRRGHPAVRLSPVEPAQSPEERRRLLEAFRGCAVGRDPYPLETAARSQDFLYGEDGMPA